MTVRNFWFAFLFYLSFFGIMILCIFTFGPVGSVVSPAETEEDAYILAMEQIEPRRMRPFFNLIPERDYDSFEELITKSTPNLIVRCTFTKRKNAVVYHPAGTSLEKYLKQHKEPVYGWEYNQAYVYENYAAMFICTPYIAEVTEVLFGDCLAVGDTFTYYAPYGKYGHFWVRYLDCPIFRVGMEYIMIFSVTEYEGQPRWYQLSHAGSVGEILPSDARTFRPISPLSYAYFEDVEYDCEELQEEFLRIYETLQYPTDIQTLSASPPLLDEIPIQ